MQYKLVLFDFDGTLADSFSWFLQTVNHVAEKHRFKTIALHELDTLRGYSSRQLMAHLGLPLWKVPAVTTEMRQLMRENAARIPLFDGVGRLLHSLVQHGIDSGVVTSNSYENVRTILGEHNVALVRHFECGASLFGKKAKFNKLLKTTGVARNEVLYIGDEIRDAEAAKAAGLDFAGVAWGYTKAEVLAQHSPTTLFRSIDDIIASLCPGPVAHRR